MRLNRAIARKIVRRYKPRALTHCTANRATCRAFASFSGGLDGICRVLLNSNEFVYVD